MPRGLKPPNCSFSQKHCKYASTRKLKEHCKACYSQESSRSTARSAFKKVHCQRRATLRATVFKEELTPQLLGSGGRVLKFSALKDSVAKLPKLNKTAYSMSRVMRPTHLLVSQGSTAQRRIKLSRKHKLHWCLKVKLEVAQRSKSFEEACTQKFSI